MTAQIFGKRLGYATAASFGVCVAGCSSNGSDPGSTDAISSESQIGCATDPRAEKLAPNLTHEGDSKQMSFVVVSATPASPAAGNNAWTVKILDPDGQPVKDAVLSFPKRSHPSDPWMPAHAYHGTVPPIATNNHDGTYTIGGLYLFMGGIWSTYIAAQSGSVADSTTFSVCIGD